MRPVFALRPLRPSVYPSSIRSIVVIPSKTNNDPQSCVELLQQMIGFDTVNRTAEGVPFVESQLAAHLESVAAGWGLSTRRLPLKDAGFNLLVTHQVGADAPWLMFDSHMDTVDVAGMTVDPFGGQIEDGKIFGRGACDTKGTGAAMLWALKSAAEDSQLSVNIAILYTIDEEAGRSGVKAFVNDQLPTLSFRPLGVIVGEPTCLRIVAAHKWNRPLAYPHARGGRPFLGSQPGSIGHQQHGARDRCDRTKIHTDRRRRAPADRTSAMQHKRGARRKPD